MRSLAERMSMTRYAALLRGINVGGRKKLAMNDLREALGALGYEDVETYLQSGNALFTSAATDSNALAGEIEQALRSRLDMDVKVLVRTAGELAEVVEGNPFPEGTAEPKKLHVAFLSAAPDDHVHALDPAPYEPDELRLGDRAVYLWYPNGYGRTKLTNDVLERKLGVTATTRNWNTVVNLLDRASAR
jgi:uncharacterized protein (DUF1697 family)